MHKKVLAGFGVLLFVFVAIFLAWVFSLVVLPYDAEARGYAVQPKPTPIPIVTTEDANFMLIASRKSQNGTDVTKFKWNLSRAFTDEEGNWVNCGPKSELPCPKTMKSRLVLSKDKAHFRFRLDKDDSAGETMRGYRHKGKVTSFTIGMEDDFWDPMRPILVKDHVPEGARESSYLYSLTIFGWDPDVADGVTCREVPGCGGGAEPPITTET